MNKKFNRYVLPFIGVFFIFSPMLSPKYQIYIILSMAGIMIGSAFFIHRKDTGALLRNKIFWLSIFASAIASLTIVIVRAG